MQVYRVEFEYTEKAVVHVPAESEDKARQGALVMIKPQVKNPEIVKVETLDDDTPTTIN